MNWTPEQIITLAGIVFGFLSTVILTVGGWVVVSKLNKANTEKAKGETIAIYQHMLKESATREEELTKRVNALEVDLGNVQEQLAKKMQENSSLQRQIAELKIQTDEQAQKIDDQEKQITQLTEKLKNMRENK